MDDDDRLTLSRPDDDQPGPRGSGRRWESLDSRLDRVARDRRVDPYDDVNTYRGRPPSRSRPILTLFLLALVGAGVVFVVAPVFAFRAVRSAAEFGDVQALGQLVDYNAVRQSLRTQIRPASAERTPPADILRDPIGALRRAWEPVSPQTDVDTFLTPDALARLSQGHAHAGAKPTPGDGLFGGPLPAVKFWSTDRVRLGVRDPVQRARETIFTFERKKLFSWRLVGVRLPEAPPSTVGQ